MQPRRDECILAAPESRTPEGCSPGRMGHNRAEVVPAPLFGEEDRLDFGPGAWPDGGERTDRRRRQLGSRADDRRVPAPHPLRRPRRPATFRAVLLPFGIGVPQHRLGQAILLLAEKFREHDGRGEEMGGHASRASLSMWFGTRCMSPVTAKTAAAHSSPADNSRPELSGTCGACDFRRSPGPGIPSSRLYAWMCSVHATLCKPDSSGGSGQIVQIHETLAQQRRPAPG